MKKRSSGNNFIILLSVFASLAVLFVILLNFFQSQSTTGRAGREYCERNSDCPIGTACENGTCMIVKNQVTQTPFAYVDVRSIVEKPKPIPTVYVTPTPTPIISWFEQTSHTINGGIENAVILILRAVGGFWSQISASFH